VSKPFLVTVIFVLVVFGSFMTVLNLALRHVNDEVAGKCLAPVIYLEPGTQA
jgi:hypothetical protein